MECQLRFRQQNQLVPSIVVGRSACLRSCSCETSLPVHPRRSPCPSQPSLRSCRYQRKAEIERDSMASQPPPYPGNEKSPQGYPGQVNPGGWQSQSFPGVEFEVSPVSPATVRASTATVHAPTAWTTWSSCSRPAPVCRSQVLKVILLYVTSNITFL